MFSSAQLQTFSQLKNPGFIAYGMHLRNGKVWKTEINSAKEGWFRSALWSSWKLKSSLPKFVLLCKLSNPFFFFFLVARKVIHCIYCMFVHSIWCLICEFQENTFFFTHKLNVIFCFLLHSKIMLSSLNSSALLVVTFSSALFFYRHLQVCRFPPFKTQVDKHTLGFAQLITSTALKLGQASSGQIFRIYIQFSVS